MNKTITIAERLNQLKTITAEEAAGLNAKAVKLAYEIMQSYPEYGSEWIHCSKYDYGMNADMERQVKQATYTFKVSDQESDCEEYETRTITPEDVAEAVPTLLDLVKGKKIHLCGLTSNSFWDAGCWDSEATDALLQVYFYGETVYG